MSILIKGMEMPTKENAVILITPSGDVWMIGDMPNEDTHLVKAKAVPVPPHGRCIDADALEKEGADIHENIVCCGYVEDSIWGFSREMIEKAPTIIEAEDGK